MAEEKLGTFDVLKEMSRRNMEVRLAPIGTNFLGGKVNKHGTRIEMAFPGNVLSQIINNEFVGGLLLCDRKQFEEVQRELEAKK